MSELTPAQYQSTFADSLTVRDLRQLIKGLPGDTPIVVSADTATYDRVAQRSETIKPLTYQRLNRDRALQGIIHNDEFSFARKRVYDPIHANHVDVLALLHSTNMDDHWFSRQDLIDAVLTFDSAKPNKLWQSAYDNEELLDMPTDQEIADCTQAMTENMAMAKGKQALRRIIDQVYPDQEFARLRANGQAEKLETQDQLEAFTALVKSRYFEIF